MIQSEPPRRIVVVHENQHHGVKHTFVFRHEESCQTAALAYVNKLAGNPEVPFNWADAKIVRDKMIESFNQMNQNPPQPPPNNSKGFTRS